MKEYSLLQKAAVLTLSAALSLSLSVVSFAEEPAAPEEVTVTSFDQLKTAAESASSPTIVKIGNDIALTESITIGSDKDITICDDGTARKISAQGNSLTTLFNVERGGRLTFDTSDTNSENDNSLLTLDGSNIKDSSNTGELINCNGTVVINGGTFEKAGSDDYSNKVYTGAIAAKGTDASIILNDGVIQNNTFTNANGANYGIIYISDGAYFEMNGGSISNNMALYSSAVNIQVSYNTKFASEANSSFVMNNGKISDNTTSYGGVYVGGLVYHTNLGFPAPMKYLVKPATMVMNGGSINNNLAYYYGGGIYISGAASVTMNDGEIVENKARMGGGVAVYDYFLDSYYNPDGVDFETWKKYYPAEFVMNGGKINNNKAYETLPMGGIAYGAGGGIYLSSDNVVLNAGEISGNEATVQGGGIYVGSVPYVLHMYDAVITENEAEILGGGMWFCPTGDATSAVTNGSAIFGNTAQGAGDDFASVPHANNSREHITNLADRALGGGEVKWYNDGRISATEDTLGEPDESVKRFDSKNPGERLVKIKNSKSSYALKSVLSENAQNLASQYAKLKITKNKSPRGGGIGSNGGIVIGKENDEWTLTVTKT